MRGLKAKKLRKILGEEGSKLAVHPPLNDLYYKVTTVNSWRTGTAQRIELINNSNRKLYKILKRTYKQTDLQSYDIK
jgi:hypothetical protein